MGGAAADRFADHRLHARQRKLPIRIAREIGRRRFRAIHHHPRAAGLHAGQGVRRSGDDDIAADHGIGFAGGYAHGMNGFRIIADADMGKHRAALLRQSGHVEHGDALAVDVRGHPDQGADGDHAGAADTGNQNAVCLGRRVKSRLWRHAE